MIRIFATALTATLLTVAASASHAVAIAPLAAQRTSWLSPATAARDGTAVPMAGASATLRTPPRMPARAAITSAPAARAAATANSFPAFRDARRDRRNIETSETVIVAAID